MSKPLKILSRHYLVVAPTHYALQSDIEAWGRFLGLKGQELEELCDLAALSRSEIPAEMASDERVLAALPAFFRAARGNELDGEKLKAFIEDIRSIHSPD